MRLLQLEIFRQHWRFVYIILKGFLINIYHDCSWCDYTQVLTQVYNKAYINLLLHTRFFRMSTSYKHWTISWRPAPTCIPKSMSRISSLHLLTGTHFRDFSNFVLTWWCACSTVALIHNIKFEWKGREFNLDSLVILYVSEVIYETDVYIIFT